MNYKVSKTILSQTHRLTVKSESLAFLLFLFGFRSLVEELAEVSLIEADLVTGRVDEEEQSSMWADLFLK